MVQTLVGNRHTGEVSDSINAVVIQRVNVKSCSNVGVCVGSTSARARKTIGVASGGAYTVVSPYALVDRILSKKIPGVGIPILKYR